MTTRTLRSDAVAGGRRGTAIALDRDRTWMHLEADGLPRALVETLTPLEQDGLDRLLVGYLLGHHGPGIWSWPTCRAGVAS